MSEATVTAKFPQQARYLAWRSVVRTARQPIIIVPPLVFPLFLLAINASGLGAATDVPGFPADTYLAFALAFPFMQGSLFATNTAGTNIAEDITAASSTGCHSPRWGVPPCSRASSPACC